MRRQFLLFYGGLEMLFVVVQKPENASEKVSYCVKSVVKKRKTLAEGILFNIYDFYLCDHLRAN